jgi:hypothetical protein
VGTTRLQIYNNALTICGETRLASLTEDRKPRRLLDQVWDSNGVQYCLEQGQWQFAMRTQRIDYDPDFAPTFGYSRAFQKPTDWVLTSAVCTDEFFRTPLLAYADELDYWYADLDEIFVKFVSNDADYGQDLGKWPASFCDYVDAYFASKVIYDLTGDKERIAFLLGTAGRTDGGELGRRLTVAKSRSAMTQPSRRFPISGWNAARLGKRGNGPMGDRGNSGSLIG